MLTLFAIPLLLAVSCSGMPGNEEVKEQSIARQFRVAAEEYFQTSFNRGPDSYDSKNVKFFLYTNEAPYKVELKTEHLQQYLNHSSYDIGRSTRVLVHDRFFSENFFKELINAYLRHFHKPVNVITVDYSYYSGYSGVENKLIPYREIGEAVAHLVKELEGYGTVSEKIHVIGHGVGAHIAAAAAHKIAPYKFGRITGLSPVGLEFDKDEQLPQLRKHDADFVDVIVTNMGQIGSNQPNRGHVNFYPNGGASQPSSESMFISHLKAYFYYVESVSRGKVFVAYAAESYADFKQGKYDHNRKNYMGAYVRTNETGNFYLDVNSVPPYSSIVDHYNRPEKAKFHETYLSWIVGARSPKIYVSKDDPYYNRAETYQRTMLSMHDGTERHVQHAYYSSEPRSYTAM